MRICATHNDSILRKRALLNDFRAVRIEDDGQTVEIGVVFHVMYRNYDQTRLKDDITYTLEMLNKDFNKENANFDSGKDVYKSKTLKRTYEEYVGLADSCNVKFRLVEIKYSPVGPQTSSNISLLDKNIKGPSPAVTPEKHLNIWIAEFSNGLLGYAQFPWELKESPTTDGVVIGLDTFGRKPTSAEYNLNKTLTHEIGHWLGLYHTFQDTFDYEGGHIDYLEGENVQELKGDCVCDTPSQGKPTYGNPYSSPSSWPTSKAADESKRYPHMFMNYMDYSDDIALFMFTRQQAVKIRQMIYLYRSGLIQPEEPAVDEDLVQVKRSLELLLKFVTDRLDK